MIWMVWGMVVAMHAFAAGAEGGARADSGQVAGFSQRPVAVVTWARVAAEVDHKLTANVGQALRLRPDEWMSGDSYWLVDAAGDPRAIVSALKTLLEGPFKDRDMKVASLNAHGAPRVELLRDLAVRAEMMGGVPI